MSVFELEKCSFFSNRSEFRQKSIGTIVIVWFWRPFQGGAPCSCTDCTALRPPLLRRQPGEGQCIIKINIFIISNKFLNTKVFNGQRHIVCFWKAYFLASKSNFRETNFEIQPILGFKRGRIGVTCQYPGSDHFLLLCSINISA